MAAAGAVIAHGVTPSAQRQSCWTGTPEVYFAKNIDNSRIVKVDDPRRTKEMRAFSIALSIFCLLVLCYAWQHFRSIEYGYKISELKSQRDSLVEMNRELHLEDASLRNPERIDTMARKLGLQSPQAGQVMRLDGSAEGSAPVMASASPISVISAR